MAVLLLGAMYALGWFGGGGTSKKPEIVNLPPWSSDKREITVGPEGEYKSIVEALKAVRRRYIPNPSGTDMMVVKIAAGTYPENISIDGSVPPSTRRKDKKSDKPVDPDWPQGIKLIADGEVILEAPQDVPAIRLKGISRFIVEGISINATGKAVGVEVSDDMPESRLSGLKITGFSQTGIACLGSRGASFTNTQFILENLKLEAGSSSAVGIRMQRSENGDPSDTVIRGCRIIGPLASGISLTGTGPYRITIAETIFSKAQDGIRLEGSVQWKDIAILNNTFHEGRHGIAFTNMPTENSMGLVFRRNLFTKMTGAEGIVMAGYDQGRLGAMLVQDRPGWELNYSDRAKPATPAAGEIVPLCATNGKQGEQGFHFASVDAKNPKFLAPTDKSVQRSVAGPKEGEKPWVGAIGP